MFSEAVFFDRIIRCTNERRKKYYGSFLEEMYLLVFGVKGAGVGGGARRECIPLGYGVRFGQIITHNGN